MSNFGYCEGDTCLRNGCQGTIERHPVNNCSCHLSAPCSACTAPSGYCDECGWEESEDEIINDYVVSTDKATGAYRSWDPRKLDPTKLDYYSKPHSSCSMIKEGVYPEGMDKEEVRKEVIGTFGGRFEHFGNGKFKFIAYTD